MKIFSHRFRAMGGPCELRLYSADQAQAKAAINAAKAEVLRLERRYSRYRVDSITSRINHCAGAPQGVDVDPETAALLDYAQTAWQHSDGLFDITSGVLRQAWNFQATRLPTQQDIDRALALIGWQRLRWQRPRLTVPLAGMQLDFGGFVKEYAADRAAQAARAAGARAGFVELAGDIALIGPHPDGSAWHIGIRDPHRPEQAVASIPLSAGAIASSGDYERFFEIDGRRYSHLLNPKTGWPVQGLAAVSVIAEQCLIAGSAATIAMLKGADAGPAWLAQLGLPYLSVDAAGLLGGTLQRRSEFADAADRAMP